MPPPHTHTHKLPPHYLVVHVAVNPLALVLAAPTDELLQRHVVLVIPKAHVRHGYGVQCLDHALAAIQHRQYGGGEEVTRERDEDIGWRVPERLKLKFRFVSYGVLSLGREAVNTFISKCTYELLH